MQIRKAELKDFEKMVSLHKELFLYEKKFNKTFNQEWPLENKGKEYFATRLVNDNSIFLILENNDEIVGYLLGFVDTYPVRLVNPIAELENVFIKEEFRSKGWGQKLMDEFKKLAKEKNAKRLRVTCYCDNKQAINFYKKNGFEDLATILESDL